MKIKQIKNNFKYYSLFILFLCLCSTSTTITYNKIILNNVNLFAESEKILENNFLFVKTIMLVIQLFIGITIIAIDFIILHSLIFFICKKMFSLKMYRFPIVYSNIILILVNIIIFLLLPNYDMDTLKFVNVVPISLIVKSIVLYSLLKKLFLLDVDFSYRKLKLTIIMYFFIMYIFSLITIFYF